MELINDDIGINTHVHLFSSKATYEILLAGLVERDALEAGENPGSIPMLWDWE